MGFRIHGAEQTSWWLAATPPNGPNGSANAWICARISFTAAGRVMGARYYQPADDDEGRVAALWDWSGVFIRGIREFRKPQDTGAGWCQTWFRKAIPVVTGKDYVVGILIHGGGYWRWNTRLAGAPRTQNGITFQSGIVSTSIEPWEATLTENTHAHAVDVLYQAD